MITETTLCTLVNRRQYDTAFMELSKKGEIKFDTRYTDGGDRVRIMGGTYHNKFSWNTTIVNGVIKELTFGRS